ncbi:MAG: acyl--CoA ligase [Rhodospirillaceae bacterium]|nr:acyl--CoA ligase [Rhodospirillaceae bacterium]MBT4428124.1 acyl--CoA ligase [Rhodospirillaceae bacterium]
MNFNLECCGGIHDLQSGESWQGARFAAETGRRAAFLSSQSIGCGDIVIISHGGTPSFFADLFAVWKTGACAVCLNQSTTAPELANLVNFIQPRAILTGENSANTDGLTIPIFQLAREKTGSLPPDRAERMGASLDDPALILFTSGTTGAPKGVTHSFRSLLARTALNRTHIGDANLARSLCVLPTHFGHGLIGNCLTPLLAGADLFLHAGMGVKAVPGLGPLLVDNDITFVSSVPTFWKIALKLAKPPAKQTLGQIHIGSAPLSAELWRAVQSWSGTDNVHNMYGITETANWLAGASAETLAPEDGLIGTMWGGSAAIVDGDELRPTGEGELAMQTPALMTGYLKRDDLTREVLRAGWFHTGDTGRIGEDGIIRLIGRRKSEINRAGMKVHPEEIDLLLERHPDVLEACAFGVPDEISGELVGTAITLKNNAVADQAQLRAWCAERIKADCVPDKWFFVAEIPKTDRGKINRDTVMQACLNKKENGT